MISTINPHELGNRYGYVFPTSLLMYTTIPIVDSKGNFGPLLNFTPPVQPFHCIQSLVPQTAVLDVQSRNLLAINPTILKTSSTWIPSTSLQPTTSGNEFIDAVRNQTPFTMISRITHTLSVENLVHGISEDRV